MRVCAILISSVTIAISIGVGVLSLPVLASADSGASAKRNPNHFELVMSQEDSICKPITVVYNHLFRKFIRDNRDDSASDPEGPPPLTDFEVTNPDAFAKAGFISPKPIKVSQYSTFYDLDLSRDGGHHIVGVTDIYPHPYTPTTIIDVFDSTISPSNLPPDSPEGMMVDPWEDTSIYDGDNLLGNIDNRFLVRYQIETYLGKGRKVPPSSDGSYILTVWPGFKISYEYYINNARNISENHPLLSMAYFNTERIFTSKSLGIFFVLDSYTGSSPVYNSPPEILVYRVAKEKPVDICYIIGAPSWDFDAYRKGSHD